MAKVFILYDGRARGGNTDDATVLTTATSESEARREGRNYGLDSMWFEYQEQADPNGGKVPLLVGKQMRPDLSPVLKGRGR